MRPWRVFLIGMLLVLGGCASFNQQVLAPPYDDRLEAPATLGLLPLGADLLPEAGQAPTPTTRIAHELFYRMFGPSLRDAAAVTLWEAGPAYPRDSVQVARHAVALGRGDSLRIPLPTAGPITIDGYRPAFVLIVDDLQVFFGSREGREGMGTIVTSQLTLTGRCTYALWDNQAQRLVGYGRLEDGVPTEGGSVPRSAIGVLYQRFAHAIMAKSPFQLKPNPYS